MNKSINEMDEREKSLYFNIFISGISHHKFELQVYTSFTGYRTFRDYGKRLEKCFDFLNESTLEEINSGKELILLGVKKEFLDNAKNDFNLPSEVVNCCRYTMFIANYSFILESDLKKQFDEYIANRKEVV